jgi:hypothetical protein
MSKLMFERLSCLLLAGFVIGGGSGQASAGTEIEVIFSGSNANCAVNGSLYFLQSHGPVPGAPGYFNFSGSHDPHFLSYTITKPPSLQVNTAGDTFVINTGAAPTPRTFQLDVTTNSNATTIEIVLTTLTDLDLNNLPFSAAFVSSSMAASGTFAKIVNGTRTFTCPITVTTCVPINFEIFRPSPGVPEVGTFPSNTYAYPVIVTYPVCACYPQPACCTRRIYCRPSWCGRCW